MESVKSLADFAAVSAAIITVLTLAALLVRTFQALLKTPQQIRAYFFRPKYILIPTPEELARYCEKSFDGMRPTNDELDEEARYRVRLGLRKYSKLSQMRVIMVSVPLVGAFLAFFWKLLYWGFLSSNDEISPIFKASLFLFLGCLSAALIMTGVAPNDREGAGVLTTLSKALAKMARYASRDF